MLLLSSLSAEASGPRRHKRLLGDGRSIYAEFFSPRPSRLTRNESDYALPGSDPRIRGRRNVELDEFATFGALLQPGRVATGVSDSGPGLRGSRRRRGVRMRLRCGPPEGTPRRPVSASLVPPSAACAHPAACAPSRHKRHTPSWRARTEMQRSSPLAIGRQAGSDQMASQGLGAQPGIPVPPGYLQVERT